MKKMSHIQSLLISLPLLALATNCLSQTDVAEENDERIDGRFLLDFSYTKTDSLEGDLDILAPGFTWLARSDLRVGISTTYASFQGDSDAMSVDEFTSSGLGDTLIFVQYDWNERLTANPWVPDDLGLNLTILAPTGDAKQSLGQDTWGAGFSFSWPVVTESMWLFNPAISYNFTFNEGPLALKERAAEFSLGIIKLFPSRFWIGYTPLLWYESNDHSLNYDDHFTMGKMFSNGMGVGLDYGKTASGPKVSRLDTSVLLNFYYQFGK